MPRWKKQKGAKDLIKHSKNGYSYRYNEGAIAFPDGLDKPARTILTGEGGMSPSRTKHVIQQDGVYRRLTPIELERLNGFPDNHTEGCIDSRRAFLMGNALVVGLIEEFGKAFIKAVKSEQLKRASKSRQSKSNQK